MAKIRTKLATLPNLKSVALRFKKNCKTCDEDMPADPLQTEVYWPTVMRWLSAGLVSLQRPLKELAIQSQLNVTPLSENVIS